MSTLSVEAVSSEPHQYEVEELFRRYYRLAFRTAYAVGGSAVDAEDVVQTIFLRLIRQEVPADLKKNPGGYLYRAAVNESLTLIRNRQRRIRRDSGTERVELQSPSPVDPFQEMHGRLYEAIAELSPEAAHILILRYIHDYSDVEIAKMLGRSRASVAVGLYRSRARLKKLLRTLE
jgi:RNA polymerase sigma-70 factor (ECF subfamily)